MENQTQSTLLARSLLDGMNQAALLFSPELQPAFMSAAAARLLQVKNRDALSECSGLFSPLLKLLEDRVEESALSPQRSQELVLHSSDGLPVPVLAAPKQLLSGEQLVYLWDLRPYQSWLSVLQQSMRARPALVYASALLGQPLNELAVEALFRHSQITGVGIQDAGKVDLLNILTIAVEIVDNLAPPTFKIGIDLPLSALLALPRAAALRILSHAFLESLDYCGPLGKATASAFFRSGSVEVLVLASRPEASDLGLGPLEMYLSRRALITEYRVGTGGGPHELFPDERTFLERHLGNAADPSGGEIKLDHIRTIPEESFSENLRIASYVADPAGAALEVRIIPPRHLLIVARLPLQESKIPKAKS